MNWYTLSYGTKDNTLAMLFIENFSLEGAKAVGAKYKKDLVKLGILPATGVRLAVYLR